MIRRGILVDEVRAHSLLACSHSNLLPMEYLDTLKDSLERDERVVLSEYDQAWPHGETLLHWLAAYRGPNNLELMRYVLESRLVHVNLENYRGATPLYYAAISCNYPVIRLLLEWGANPRIRSSFSGQFPLEALRDRVAPGESETRIEEAVRDLGAHELTTVPLDRTLRIKEGFTHYHVYGYRRYMHALATLNVLYAGKRTTSDLELDEEVVDLYRTGGLAAATERLDSLMKEEWYGRLECKETHICLVCSKVEGVRRCGGCKRAYFCDVGCQRIAHRYHRYDCR